MAQIAHKNFKKVSVSKHRNGAFRVRETLQKVEYSVLKQMRARFFDPTPPLQKNSNYFKISEIIEKIICGYMLRKPNFRLKKRNLKLCLSPKKCKREDSFGFLKLHFVAKYQKVGDKNKISTHSRTVLEKFKRGPNSLVRFCILR